MALTLAAFRMFYDGEMMPLAYFIGQLKELLPRPFCDLALIHICLKGFAVGSAHIIKNRVQMNMVFIGMNCKEILIIVLQEFFAQLFANLHRSFRSDLTRRKALNKVLGKDSAFACSRSTDSIKVFACLYGIGTASECEDQSAVVGLCGVGDIR